jgi:hypothetical protein
MSLERQATLFVALVKMRLNPNGVMGEETNEFSHLIKTMIDVESRFPWFITAGVGLQQQPFVNR